jgi:hypothetical protein
MAIGIKNLTAIFVFSIALSLMGHNALSAEKKPVKVPVFEVPTSGKIMDVQYRPEFDEWWVKCREGNDIVIYSYDKISRKWGRVLFTTKKPDEKAKATGGTEETVTANPSGGAPKDEKKPDGGTTEGPKKQTDASQKKSEQKKWWDPLNIIQGGERLISPGTPPASK